MYTKEQLLSASAMSKMTETKGVLNLAEANERIRDARSLTTITSSSDNVVFITDDHCFGYGVLPNHYVPGTSCIPLQVVAREELPTGVITSAEEYLLIFNKENRYIASIEELVKFLNGEKDFIVYWRYGEYSTMNGKTIEEAFTKAGYGGGAIAAVDFYNQGSEPCYVWNKDEHEWIKK